MFISFKEFVFFDNFCPLYPSWVGPGAATGYLKETFDYATKNLHKVHFRLVEDNLAKLLNPLLDSSAFNQQWLITRIKVPDQPFIITASSKSVMRLALTVQQHW